MFDLLLRGGVIIDGSGSPRYDGCVGVNGDRIVAVGDLASAAANRVIDVDGLVVAPGFIDVHNHSDGLLLRHSHVRGKTAQGFTTEVIMADGISYAPVNEHTWREWFYYLRALNGLRMDEYAGWQSLEQYMMLLDGGNVQNSATHAPYANLRALACGFGRSAVDDFQMRQIQDDLRACMEQGAVGVSTGLDYIVQCFSTTDELVEACQVVGEYEGLYATHVRYKKGLLAGLLEAVDIVRRCGARLHISHLKGQTPGEVEQILSYLDEVRRDVDVTFDIYPYQPGSTMLSYLVPYDTWENGPLASSARLCEPVVRERFRRGLEAYRLDLDQIRIAWTLTKDNSVFEGALLSDYVRQTGLPPEEAMTRLLVEERMAVLLVFEEGEDELVHPFMQHDLFMLGSDGIYPGGSVHPRFFGSAARLLGTCVRDHRLFSLEEAVHKMSGKPAERFRLVDRGEIREGAFADLVVFDPTAVRDLATYENPEVLAAGVEHLFVNGQPVLLEGEPVEQGERAPGRYLRCGA